MGRTAAVTGAARGIGTAIADGLAAAGHDVAVLDLDADAAGKVAAGLAERHGVRAVGVGVDITDAAGVSAAVARVTGALGPVEVLVNNAGVDVIKPFLESTEEEWARIVSVNLLGTIRVTRAVLDAMVERGWGRVVMIASDAGRVGSSGEVVYSGSKGGVIAFGKALAREVARHGVTVNSVCPGPTDTALLDQVAAVSQKLYDGLAKAVPMRRIATPEDIAPAVVFLASDGAGYTTGQTLSVSGGLTMA
ncbi:MULTISPECIES: SDR family NAD(P)-dependent oxidoreductase [unclassified Pseudofrankia]|uniref:SDR family NAD(P)-dependent oxidoreductase n=1 Tax=unclassified Pseudofrankia TaxID=2994372 RepID=UPI0008D8FB52|nr:MULTISPECIES: SDR family oxidoreductase [unclassified Pseudofrankia]MDT3441975.1 SDR family oxidoreductase [Pseudofrankia sp. BMG5.37]OHV44602.1 2-hydroxycyclohexanecarboxyl-CoA dehydrogenase [Pseudofrankia sp. BMG5.36]